MLTALGITFFLIPFILIFCFEDKVKGFLYVFTSTFFFHIFLGITTQALHVFTYSFIVSVNAVISMGSVFLFYKHKKPFQSHVNWITILAFLVIFFELWSVHYAYKGPVNTIRGAIETASENSYPYPYFSDEWVGVGLSRYAIEHNALPLVDSFMNGYPSFSNPLIGFFSFSSELFILFNLNPLYGYAVFALVFGMILSLIFYLFLRSYGLGKIPSLVPLFLLPYIANGANIPGMWYFLPYIVSFIFFLISLSAIIKRQENLSFFSGFISLILYPPMIVFLIASFLFSYRKSKKLYIGILGVITISGAIIGALLHIYNPLELSRTIQSFISRATTTTVGIPLFTPWNILPISFITLPLILLGLLETLQKRIYPLFAPVLVGCIFWVIYAYNTGVFIIEYPRVVIITSILLIILLGIGMELVMKKLKESFALFQKSTTHTVLSLIFVVLFFILSFSYTEGGRWKTMTLNIEGGGGIFRISPAPPANRYLTEEDLILFKRISESIFLAPPWKGLVIGVATNNFPLETKTSTITNEILSYASFMNVNCEAKDRFARLYGIKYVYSDPFDCREFISLGQSEEKLTLYHFLKN